MTEIDTLINYIKKSKKTVFFGGAGTSTESGLKDFRSKDGLYNESYKYRPEVILSHDFFVNNTKEFYEYYKNKMNSTNYNPNIVHEVLKKLEDKNLLSSIITQNIDGFHTKAGSKNVLELHGTILNNYCMKCNKKYDYKKIFNNEEIPTCSCGGIIKPDVILYDEMLNEETLEKAINEIKTCDLLIIGGTSLNVYPAAGLINYFNGDHIVIINNEKTKGDQYADIVINDSLGKVFKIIEKEMNL